MSQRRNRAAPKTENGQPLDDAYQVQIAALSHDGRGIARIGNRPVFIADTLPCETIRFSRGKRRRGFDEGELLEVVEAAAQRTTPRCPHFGYCGGCSLQHLEHAAQAEVKQQHLLETLNRIGKVAPAEILEPITAEPWGYRRRARLGVKHVPKKGGVLVGFRERKTSYIAVLDACEVLDPAVGHRLQELMALLDKFSIRAQLPQIEVAVADNAVALVLRVLAPPSEDDLRLLEAFSREQAVWFYLQPGGLDSVKPLRPDTPPLTYALPAFELRLQFEPVDFIQVNAAVNRQMVDRTVELLAPQSQETVLDLFAGIGNFTLPLATRAGKVIGVEGDSSLIERLRLNAQHNGLDNVQAFAADLFEVKTEPAWLAADIDKVLLDPPRAGAKQVLPAIAARQPQRIVYVSCHPATLARDAQSLVHAYGYVLQAAGLVDMFPHTGHTEAMAVFTRAD